MTTTRTQRRLATLTAGAALAVLVPGIAVAASGFRDVPASYTHAPGIDYVADAGITAGCGNGQDYCPNDAVTRGQMATFLHRSSGNGSVPPSVNAATLEGLTADEIVDRASSDGFVPFSAALATGDEVTVATHGPLSLVAQCLAGETEEAFRLVVTSSVDGWYSQYEGDTALGAGEESALINAAVPTGEEHYDSYIDGSGAFAPTGEYLAVQLETTSYGLNVLGHDCVVAGVAFVQDVDL